MIDPRESIIAQQVSQIQKIIIIASGKGGVGKSMVACSLALLFLKQGKRVGLLDLDMYGPSAHVILGANPHCFPEEDNGILPFNTHGISFMSTVFFTKDKPAAFRGNDITNIMIELLAITRWDKQDVLLVDMPPGLGDEMLDILHLLPNKEFLVVTTSSKVSYASVEKLLLLCQEINVPLLGVIENMADGSSKFIQEQLQKIHVPWLGGISYDTDLEHCIGLSELLLKSKMAQQLHHIITTHSVV